MSDELKLEIDAKEFLSLLERADKKTMQVGEQAMNDVVDELIRISSEITPFDKGTLSKSHSRKVMAKDGNVEAEVEYSVREGDFNYALWTHEGVYEYGEGTKGRSGTTGWSGKSYEVGRKYLERPLKGEEEAFIQYIANKIKDAVGE